MVRVEVIAYTPTEFLEEKDVTIGRCRELVEAYKVTWVNVVDADGRTIEDFRSRHLRVVGARDLGLDHEEQALLSLLRSWRIRQSRAAA